jgi:prevent-host-death family protein
MKKVKTSELKAKLSSYLRMVRRGVEIVVFDRNLPIAKITSIEEKLHSREGLIAREAVADPASIELEMPDLKPSKTNSVATLLDDRNSR